MPENTTQSVGLADAFHEQAAEPERNQEGAPHRAWVLHSGCASEAARLQDGKRTRMRIDAVENSHLYPRRPWRFWEDRGYEWYAGI